MALTARLTAVVITCLYDRGVAANTKSIGEISEAIVLAEFLKAGFPVLLPFGENQRYDMVVEAEGRFLRVQCKTARVVDSDNPRRGSGAICFNACSNPRDRVSYRDQADLFAVYSPDTKQVYVLAVDEVPEREVWLRVKPAGNNQSVGVRWARDHTLEAWAAGYEIRAGLEGPQPAAGTAL